MKKIIYLKRIARPNVQFQQLGEGMFSIDRSHETGKSGGKPLKFLVVK
jgi:hypothetical protein